MRIVTCGVSIEDGFEDTSLHGVPEKERHRFPEVLHRILFRHDGDFFFKFDLN